MSEPVKRMIAALSDPDATFTTDQVAYLMALSARWAREAVEEEPSELSYRAGFEAGYRDRCDEENNQYRKDCETIYFDAGAHITGLEQRQLRVRLDREALIPRLGDYTGGPVDWETSRPLHTPTPVHARPTPARLPAGVRSINNPNSTLTGSAA